MRIGISTTFLSLVLYAAGCNSSTTSKDLSGFDDFRMDFFYAPYPCSCSDGCVVPTHIVRQDDDTYRVEFENSSRELTSEEAAQLRDLFDNVEFANTFLACITGTASTPDCHILFVWGSLDGSSSAHATNAPCMLGSDPLTLEQADSIMSFMAQLKIP